MGIKYCQSDADLLDTYVNSSFDIVKSVYDNLDSITNASNLIAAYWTSSTVPTVRPNGDALAAGDRYFNTNNERVYIYTSEGWRLENILESVVENTVVTVEGRTTITTTAAYTPNTNNIAVFVNGVYQISTSQSPNYGSYTEVNSNNVTFLDALDVGDLVTIIINSQLATETVQLVRHKLRYKVTTSDINAGGQLFTLPNSVTYVPGSNTLDVYVNGIYQSNIVLGTDDPNYVEISTTQISFSSSLELDDIIDFVITSI